MIYDNMGNDIVVRKLTLHRCKQCTKKESYTYNIEQNENILHKTKVKLMATSNERVFP